ncbi:Esterase FE4 [Melipona quadrifasciata]|uniref:Carboxylic ester hydrolase n=1 Tax=Melipona quadrifasciata TaxID=166423 RepID=A0A0M9A466_9HYME|nr:Esterase FE4 [Melipona quadrifasciata]
MKGILIIFFCMSGLAIAQQTTEEQPLVTAPIGKIRGSILTSRLGRKIYSFRGIRYGEPPIGEQRFQPPIPANDWRNVFDATEEGPSCPYPDGKIMSEDCLRLNVYTTKLPCKDENVTRPVMIFIHPGGFYGFSGQSANFGPQYLLDKDIVLVTINYRLGILGFLNTGESLAPGNMGLKDQVLAFQWVQRNIAAFGGNPNSVTLCGYSAGSFSIMLHMVSPMSRNLFHRAITMSSSPIGAEVYSGISQHGQLELVQKQARLLDCPTDSTSSMISCFRSKPAENFTDTLSSLFDWYGNPILLWKPTVEPKAPGVERFLTDQPYNLIKQRKFHQVPLIMGVTEDEFGDIKINCPIILLDCAVYEKEQQLGDGTLYRALNGNWSTLAPIIFMYERDTPQSNYISRELRKFYFDDEPINSANNRKLSKVYADSVIIFPMYRTARLFATYCRHPVYFYKFTFQGRNSFYMLNDTTFPPFFVFEDYGAVLYFHERVSHHDDLQYLFFMKNFFSYFESDAPEIPMVEISTSIWSNFVINGEPIPKDDDKLRNVKWTRLVPEQTNFLELNLHPSMKTEFFPERMRLWERLFPLPSVSRTVKH